jgi:phage/plasmid-like protein (TIGR03299 family)
MAHCIEVNDSMFSLRQKPWHYESTKDRCKIIQEAPNSKEALIAAGLDWTVEQTPVFMDDGTEIKNYKANIRSDDKTVLGIVTNRYKIVQNADAFSFTDAIVGETEDGIVRYETAGSLNGGKRVWLLAKMPTKKVLDDDVEPYMVFSNSHDGTGAIKICMTPIRVVCNNTLSLALNTAQRSWSTKHVGNLDEKLAEARHCLGMANLYMDALDEEADRLANIKLDYEQINEILDQMFPVTENDSDRKKANIQKVKDNYSICYFMPDIAKFKGTAWAAVNAMSDMIGHSAPNRNTANYEENRWSKIMDGHAWMDEFVKLINAKVGAVA